MAFIKKFSPKLTSQVAMIVILSYLVRELQDGCGIRLNDTLHFRTPSAGYGRGGAVAVRKRKTPDRGRVSEA
ncbi:hypothetical protein DYH55_12235 [Methylovirgula sp. 4M-Z18]|nr:hypothetical protein DYH55_12235 [Methylovirgula sp. 4M-Z18]